MNDDKLYWTIFFSAWIIGVCLVIGMFMIAAAIYLSSNNDREYRSENENDTEGDLQ